jgi:acetyltransferase-like isoleucine patch superfamily enzyme
MKQNSGKRFAKWKRPRIVDGKPTRYGWIVQGKKKFKLGKNTDIGAFTYIHAKYGVSIEDAVQVGSHCSIYSYSTIDDKKGSVTLGRNCKIGSHSVIMPGVRVGKNSVVGAFSFVNKSIPDNVVVWGVPARVVRNV